MRCGRYFRWCSARRCCTRRQAACSGPASSRSASGWSARRRSASGSAAMRALPRSATGSRPPRWARCGYFFSAQAVFFVTAALLIPTLFALSRIRPREIDPELAHGGAPPRQPKITPRQPAQPAAPARRCSSSRSARAVSSGERLDAAADGRACVTTRSSEWATVLIAACIVVPQIVVALISPWVGHQAQIWGRRWFLLHGFAALVDPRAAVRDRDRPLSAGRRATARRHHGRDARRDGAVDDRRYRARHRALQFRAGHRRHRGRASAHRSARRSPAT